ncbi:MAG: acyl-CoA dehydrogenase, partial [Mangrovimonas sp.]|nr:acyl-CoA dehydrogenase [Mangrovimonas sp.]
VAGAAVQKFMTKLADEQEVLMNLADMMIEGYVAESVVLRVEKLVGIKGEAACQHEIDMARIFLHNAMESIATSGREAIYAFAEGDEMRMMLMGLKRFTKEEPFNVKEARRRVANYVIEKNEYPFVK